MMNVKHFTPFFFYCEIVFIMTRMLKNTQYVCAFDHELYKIMYLTKLDYVSSWKTSNRFTLREHIKYTDVQ
jgi:hypothetical protein